MTYLIPKIIFKEFPNFFFLVIVAVISRIGRLLVFFIPIKLIYIYYTGEIPFINLISFEQKFEQSKDIYIVVFLLFFLLLFLLVLNLSSIIQIKVNKISRKYNFSKSEKLKKKFTSNFTLLVYLYSNLTVVLLCLILLCFVNSILIFIVILGICLYIIFFKIIKINKIDQNKININDGYSDIKLKIITDIFKGLIFIFCIYIITININNQEDLIIGILAFVVLRRLLNSIFSFIGNAKIIIERKFDFNI